MKDRNTFNIELTLEKPNYTEFCPFLAHLSRRLVGELIVYPWSGVRPSSTISNMNISATSGPITMKFYQKHHSDEGKVALGFWAGSDQNSGFHGNR